MAFLLPILEGAGAGLLGNTLGGIFGGGAAGSAENGAMNALNSQDESFQLGMYASEIQNQEQLQVQSEVFDQMMDERSENMREIDTLRNVDMAQRKADDSITKEIRIFPNQTGMAALWRIDALFTLASRMTSKPRS